MNSNRNGPLLCFLIWSLSVVIWTSAMATSKSISEAGKDELVKEIDNLQVIQAVNAGRFNSDDAALTEPSEVETDGFQEPIQVIPRHRSRPRSILSQR